MSNIKSSFAKALVAFCLLLATSLGYCACGVADDGVQTSQTSQTAVTTQTTEASATTDTAQTTATTQATTSAQTTTATQATTSAQTTTATQATTSAQTTTAAQATTSAQTTTPTTKPPQTASTTSATTAQTTAPVGVTYILNTSTKKIHYPSCSSAKRIAEKNRGEHKGDYSGLLEKGYKTCKNCFK